MIPILPFFRSRYSPKMASSEVDVRMSREATVGLRAQKAQPATSCTDTDQSVPDLDKIRFDDNVVSITDPDPPKKTAKKEKRKKENAKDDVSPQETIRTAETFELGRNSEELILVSPGGTRKAVHQNKKPSKEQERRKAAGHGIKGAAAPEKDEGIPDDEPCIRIGDRYFSREQTANMLQRLDEMKTEQSIARRRRSNYNRIESCRTSRLPSPKNEEPLPVSSKELAVKKRTVNQSKEVKPYVPRPNYHRIESCRTSRASSPQETKGIPKKRVRVGDHFMTVEEAQDLLQRYLKESSIRARRQAKKRSKENVYEEKESAPKVVNVKMDNRVVPVPVLEPQRTEDDDCNFTHYNMVIETEDEITALLLSIIVGVILFLGLCIIVGKLLDSSDTYVINPSA